MAGGEVDSKPAIVQEEQEQKAENGDPTNLLSTGRRHMACGDFSQAVEVLASACEILAAKHGDQSNELAEPYFQYGKALLELGRTENGVLGNALDGVAAEEEDEDDLSESEQFGKASQVRDEERDGMREQVYDAMSTETRADTKLSDGTEKDETIDTTDRSMDTIEGKSSDDKTEERPEEEKSADSKTENTATSNNEGSLASKTEDTSATESTDETSATVKTDDSASISTKDLSSEKKQSDTSEVTEECKMEAVGDSITEGEKTADSGGDDRETEDESLEDEDEEPNGSQDDENMDAEDIPNLQLSWEVLELSKKIYEKLCVEQPELKSKLADVYLSLGEVAVESESYEQAVADFNSGLEIQKICLEEHDRLIAETHYQLGIAHSLNRDHKQAVDQLNTAKLVLEKRIAHLESQKTSLPDDVEKFDKELLDIKQLIPDIVSKIEDAVDELKNSEEVVEKVKSVLSANNDGSNTQIGFGSASSNDSPVSTIAVKKPNDISNLVRKRKPEDEPSSTAEKKSKQNGDTPVTTDQENQVS